MPYYCETYRKNSSVSATNSFDRFSLEDLAKLPLLDQSVEYRPIPAVLLAKKHRYKAAAIVRYQRYDRHTDPRILGFGDAPT